MFENNPNLPYFTLILIWELTWKGVALWKAARHEQKKWFIALFLINSIGILPIVYLKFFQKKN